jgi:hypothetical protein
MGAAASADVSRNAELMHDLDCLVLKQQRLAKAAFAHRNAGAPTISSSKTTHSAAAPAAHAAGARVYMWKQDPSVARIGVRKAFLPHDVKTGPKDDLIEVVMSLTTKAGKVEKDHKASAPAVADDEGDFLADIEADPFCFDLVHTYAVARMTVDMYVRDLHVDWKWHWDRDIGSGQAKTPLKIVCHAGEKANATYHRGKQCLKFYFKTVGSTTAYLCRSFDIVAHETGHAILDALKPSLYKEREGQAGALHEAFADLTAIFAALDQLDLCEDIVAETKSDLRKAKYLTAIGEQFAAHMSQGEAAADDADGNDDDHEHQEVAGMRNANNDLTGLTCGKDIYSICNVFTGFVYDILVRIFEWERNPLGDASDAETLHRVARVVRRILLLSLFNSSDVPSYVELAGGMVKAVDVVARRDHGDVAQYKTIIAECRDARVLHQAGVTRKKETVDLGSW